MKSQQEGFKQYNGQSFLLILYIPYTNVLILDKTVPVVSRNVMLHSTDTTQFVYCPASRSRGRIRNKARYDIPYLTLSHFRCKYLLTLYCPCIHGQWISHCSESKSESGIEHYCSEQVEQSSFTTYQIGD